MLPFFRSNRRCSGRPCKSHRGTMEQLEDRRLLAASPRLLADVFPGTSGSSGNNRFFESGGNLFFAANSNLGTELWITDGTTRGTALVKDIAPGPDSSISTASSTDVPAPMIDLNGTLLFIADDGTHGRELRKSDGTSAGTTMVKDIHSGPGSSLSSFTSLEVLHGEIYFSASDGLRGTELWKSDGTENGTVQVKDIAPGADSSAPRHVTNVGGTIFFSASPFSASPTNSNNQGLWKSDGTDVGTSFVKDLRLLEIVDVDGTAFLSAAPSPTSSDFELWKSDGTTGGTVLVKDLSPGGSSSPRELTEFNGELIFTAFTDANGRELWKSDGTNIGTTRLSETIAVGAGTSNPPYFTKFGTELFFTARGPQGGELWKTDGTSSGTILVKDIRSGPGGSYPGYLTESDGLLYFAAISDPAPVPNPFVYELWKSNGTAPGTEKVAELPRFPGEFVSFQNNLYFFLSTSEYGFEPWVLSDNSPPEISAQTFSILEGAAIATPVGTIIANDEDAGDALNYSVESGNTGGAFAVDQMTGELTVANASAVDFESNALFQLTVRVEDESGESDQATITVNIGNVAPSAPFDSNANGNSINEGAATGVLVGITAAAIDPNGPTPVYRLSDDADGKFSIDPISGIVSIADGSTLDGGSLEQIQIVASDETIDGLSSTFQIQVNNVAPVANAGPDQTVTEGTQVHLNGTFTDQGKRDGHLQQWSVVSSNGQAISGLTIDNRAGDSNGSGGSSFSFLPNDNGIYTVTYSVTDDDGGTHSDQVTITVNNAAPTLALHAVSMISENQFVTLAGTISDPSSADTFRLEIDWGDPLSPNNQESIDLTAPPAHVSYDSNTRAFSITHQYLDDNPTSTSGDDFQITVKVLDDDFQLSELIATGGTIFGGVAIDFALDPTINNAGDLFFHAGTNVFSGIANRNAFVIAPGDVVSGNTIVTAREPAISNSGDIAFEAVYDDVTSTRRTGIFKNDTILFQSFGSINGQSVILTGEPVIDDAGNVAFIGSFTDGGGVFRMAIFRNDQILAMTGDVIGGKTLATGFNDLAMDNSGGIAFRANATDGNATLFSQNDVLLQIGDVIAGKTVTGVGNVALSGQGVLAMGADFAGGSGLIVDGSFRVQTGDVLDGKTILNVGDVSINDNRDLAFRGIHMVGGVPRSGVFVQSLQQANVASTSVNVKNTAPQVTNLAAADIVEHQSTTLSGRIVDAGSLDEFSLTIDWGNPLSPNNVETIDLSSPPSHVTFDVGSRIFSATHQYLDDNPSQSPTDSYQITVTVEDDDTDIGANSTSVDVQNAVPRDVVIDSAISDYVLEVGEPELFATATPFTDGGTLDTHTATWTFTRAVGQTLVTETRGATVIQGSGSGSLSDSFQFDEPGRYDVHLTVTDDDNGTSVSQNQTFTVYDPSGGLLVGSASLPSAAGAYLEDPNVEGTATVGFAVHYRRNADRPSGSLFFRLRDANLTLRSSSLDWLVLAGSRGQIQGSGTINRHLNVGFQLTVNDESVFGGGTDKLRMKIWEKDTGTIIYDNQLGDSDNSPVTTDISRGIVIIFHNPRARQVRAADDVEGVKPNRQVQQPLPGDVDQAMKDVVANRLDFLDAKTRDNQPGWAVPFAAMPEKIQREKPLISFDRRLLDMKPRELNQRLADVRHADADRFIDQFFHIDSFNDEMS